MKLSSRAAEGYFAEPDRNKAGLLIFGGDAMRVAMRRQQVLSALLGKGAEEEMRLTRLAGADLRRDPAALLDAVKARGFFDGPRAVFVEDAGEQAVPAVEAALADWADGDAQIIVTAGSLKASSKLRKLFEGADHVYAVGIYDDPPSRAEIERLLSRAGLRDIAAEAQAVLSALASDLGPGDFAQLAEKLALYKGGDPTPLSPEDVEACAPRSTDAALDDILHVVAEAKSGDIAPLMRRLTAQGMQAVTLCIGATRHFRTLYTIASDPGGPGAGIGKLRPPVYGPRRDRLVRQAQSWGAARLEQALGVLTDTDLLLRSAGQTAPQMAVVERAFIRLAMLGRKR